MVVTIPCFFLVCLNSLRCIKLKFTLKKNDATQHFFIFTRSRVITIELSSCLATLLLMLISDLADVKKKGIKLHLHESDTSGKSINQHCQLTETFEELFNTLMIKKTHRDINVK